MLPRIGRVVAGGGEGFLTASLRQSGDAFGVAAAGYFIGALVMKR